MKAKKVNRSEEFKMRQTILRICLISRRIMDYQYYKDTSEDLWIDQEFFGYEEYDLLNNMFENETSIPFDGRKHYYNFLHFYSALPNMCYDNWNYAQGEEELPFKGGKKFVYWSRFGGDITKPEEYYDTRNALTIKRGILPHFYKLDMCSFINQVKTWIDNGDLSKEDPDNNEFDAFTNLIISHCFSDKALMAKLVEEEVIDEKSLETIYEEFDNMYDFNVCMQIWRIYIEEYKKGE